ncbi:protein pxr1-like [Limosa lapponica baueri]|uniref:Protein pxr1-like n=1 Tax=Limosa lapponica baueri TaxID=1758121 RepID=A0A2I0TVT9_LIMLA|nr:protein pxr1-like [Limosa lapponica baueri]
MSASSKSVPLLAEAEPISHGGSISGVMYLRRRKKNVQQQADRRVRIRERNGPADTKVSGEGGGGSAPGAGAEISLQPVVKTLVRQAVPLQPLQVHGGAEIHLQPVEDSMLEQTDAQRRLWPRVTGCSWQDCGPMERGARAGAGLLEGLVTLRGTYAGAACS